MEKKLKKLLAMALSLVMLFTCFTVPMGARAETPAGETYETANEILFTELKDEGNYLSGEKSMGVGSKAFTFNADSYSNVVKLRWKAGVTATNEFKVSFDENGDQISEPFGFGVKASDGATSIDTVVFQNGLNTATKKLDAPIEKDDEHDIELGRLKVLTGDNIGKYYVYLKFDNELIGSAYVTVDENNQYASSGSTVSMTHSIRFVTYGRGGADVIKEMYVPETYEIANEILFTELKDEGNYLSGEKSMGVGSKAFTFEADTYSNIVKLRWKAGVTATNEFKVSFDENGDQISEPFGFGVKASDGAASIDTVVFQNGLNTATKKLDAPIEKDDEHDIELGRQRVLTGTNEGKYYVYLKFDNELIGEAYVSVDRNNQYTASNSTVTMAHSIRFVTYGRGGADVIKEMYVAETYETATEIGFADLIDEGTHLSGEKSMGVGSKAFTFEADTYSNIVKLRWKAGVTATNEFKMSFDEVGDQISESFGFGVKASDGATSIDTIVFQNGLNTATKKLDAPINKDDEHDIELGRQRVLTGTNEGKYYVYLKFDNELIGEAYVSVDRNNQYAASNSTVTMAHSFRFVTYGRGGADVIKEMYVAETYESATEIGFADLIDEGTHLSGEKSMGVGSKAFTFEADTYSNVVKLRWKAGVTAANEFKVSFDEVGDQISNPFGFAVKSSDGTSTIDTIVFQNELNTATKVLNEPIEKDDEHDIELGRLKVLTGANTGKYYVYLRFDDELIGEAYVSVNESNQYTASDSTVTMAHSIRFVTYGRGGADIIKELYVPETFETATEISFVDLIDEGTHLSGEKSMGVGSKAFTFEADTYSNIVKLRWKAGVTATNEFKMSFDEVGDQISEPFGFGVKASDGATSIDTIVFQNGLNTATKKLAEPIEKDDEHNIELGRLKVLTGANTGKYYVYLKFDNELIGEAYVSVDENNQYTASDSTVTMTHSIRFVTYGRGGADVIKGFYVPETYEDYDEIGYADLKENGVALGSQKEFSNSSAVLTYDRTSTTGSVIFKYRWKVGTLAKFQLSFEKTSDTSMAYMFGAWLYAPGEEADYPNGRMWLRPSYGPSVGLVAPLAVGTNHNVEFARLKVKTGTNTGKYYVYIKIDDVLIAESYVDANVVDSNGNYTSNPQSTACAISNEIFFSFWGSDGNIISPYREANANEHEGTSGDFDNDGIINEGDIALIRKIMAGVIDISELPEEIADINKDGKVNSVDIVVMKKDLLAINTYEKSGSLVLGTQEHLNDDESKTAEYIADASATLGAGAYRLSKPIHSLYYVTSSNGVEVKEENMEEFKEMVKALTEKGITEILYVTDSFILPYGYNNPDVNHNKTVPDPVTDPENYEAWLTVNAAAFKALAEAFPQIKFYEPYNEINIETGRLETPGIGWEASEAEQIAHRYTVQEKAGIMADLCWYVSRAVKSVDATNQVTTPSICAGTNEIIESDFLEAFYDAIESDNYPTGKVVADKRIDNYFTIVNVHAYPEYVAAPGWFEEDEKQDKVDEWASWIQNTYSVVKEHNDGGSRVWLTETGMSTYDDRDEDRVADIIGMALEKLDTELTFVDTVFLYKIADISTEKGLSDAETYYGLFRSGDDLDYPFDAKASARTVYSFFHDGSTDYSAINELVSRYAEQ